jgi:hypothetical protein
MTKERRPPMIFKPDEIPSARGQDTKPKRGRPKKIKTIIPKPRDLLTYSQIKSGDLETYQIGPRIPVLHVEYLKSVFQKSKYKSNGYSGIQQMIIAFIETIKRHPELEKEALEWINDT